MRNKIYNQDCRDVLVKIPSETIDGVFTDPPFNIDLKPQRGTHGTIANDALSEEEFAGFITTVFEELYRVLKPNSAAWICCNWQCVSVFDTLLKRVGFTIENCVVWVKNNWGLGYHFRPQHEFILVAFKGEPPVPETGVSNVWEFDRATNTIHPNEKPVEMIQLALSRYNKTGDVILDPFAGSFSSCVAAKNMGMDYIGCELKPEHYKTGEARLKGGQFQVFNAKGKAVYRQEGTPLADLFDED